MAVKSQKKSGKKLGTVSIPLGPDTKTVTEEKTGQVIPSTPMEAGLTMKKESQAVEAIQQKEENVIAAEKKPEEPAKNISQNPSPIEAKRVELMNSLDVGDMLDVN